MIKPRRVGHATFETTDIEKQIAYWTEVAGLVLAEREKKRAFLASKTGLLSIQLEQTDRNHCARLSFEVAPDSDFDALAKELGKDGVKSELRNDSIPGMGKVLTFKDNKDTCNRPVHGVEVSRLRTIRSAASARSSSGTSRSIVRT